MPMKYGTAFDVGTIFSYEQQDISPRILGIYIYILNVYEI